MGDIEYLCATNVACLDVTHLGTGTTHDFDGLPASTSFYYQFGVPGTGSMSAWSLTAKSVTVSHT